VRVGGVWVRVGGVWVSVGVCGGGMGVGWGFELGFELGFGCCCWVGGLGLGVSRRTVITRR
jgi:hypothetical protein